MPTSPRATYPACRPFRIAALAPASSRCASPGFGYPKIAKLLNDERVPTFGKGKLWYGPVVRGICIRELGGADASLKPAGTKRPTKKAGS